MSTNKKLSDVITEIENWLRLATFQHEPLKIALLDILHNSTNDPTYVGLPAKPLDLCTELNTRHAIVLKNLKKKKVLKKAQIDMLNPPHGNTYSERFDITLIVILITNCTTLQPPQNGWAGIIYSTDFSKAAYVIRAREWRNYVHHTEPKEIKDAIFNAKWLEGVKIITVLGSSYDHNKLKGSSLDPKHELVLASLNSYIVAGKDSIDKKLLDIYKGQTEQSSLIDTLRNENDQLQQYFKRLESEIQALREIKDTGNRDDMVLPEVLTIILNEIGENWKNILFEYNKITWKQLKDALKRIKREDIIQKIRRKTLLENDGIKRTLRPEVIKVINDGLEDMDKLSKKYNDLYCYMEVGDDSKEEPITWEGLKIELIKVNQRKIIKNIQDATIITKDGRDIIVQPKVIDIVSKSIGDDWKKLSETSSLHRYLTFVGEDRVSWKVLKKKLIDKGYEPVLNKIKKDTLLTYDIRNASFSLKKHYINKLINWIIDQPIQRNDEDPFNDVLREDAYVDLAIIEAREAAKLWKNDSKSSDREFHLNLNYLERKTIPMEDVFSRGDSFVILRGIAGIGKSTMVDTYTLKWAKTKLLCDQIGPKVDFLFKFNCRELNNYKNIDSIAQLLKCKYPDVFAKLSIEDLEEISDKVLILVDGIDELVELPKLVHCSEGDLSREAIIKYLMCTNSGFLNGHKTIVAGRPEACQQLKCVFEEENIRIKMIEICGFSKTSIDKYINLYYRNKPIIKDAVKNKIGETENLSVMASIPVYLWVICSIYYQENVDIIKLNTTTELCTYACLFFIRNHLKTTSISKPKTLNEMCSDTNIIKVIIALGDLSMSTLFQGKVVFSKSEVEYLASPIPLEETGFIVKHEDETNGSIYQFKHLVLQEYLCALCIYLTKCFKKFSNSRNFNNCLPIIAGLSSIEMQGQDTFLCRFIHKLQEHSWCSAWKQNGLTSMYYSRATVTNHLNGILKALTRTDEVVITDECSSLLSIFYEYQHPIHFPMILTKQIFVRNLLFHHDIRNVLHFIHQCNIDTIHEICITNLCNRKLPNNIIDLFQLFLGRNNANDVSSLSSCCCILQLHGGGDQMKITTSVKLLDIPKTSSLESFLFVKKIKIINVTFTNIDNEYIFRTIHEDFLSALFKMVDQIVLNYTIVDIYDKLRPLLISQEESGLSKVKFEANPLASETNKLSVYSKQKLPLTHFDLMQDYIAAKENVNNTAPNTRSFEYMNISNYRHINNSLATFVPFYKVVDIGLNRNLSSSFFNALDVSYTHNKNINQFHLRSLNLSNCNLNYLHLKSLQSHIADIETINLSHNILNVQSVNLLVECIKNSGKQCKLRALILSSCELEDESSMKLLECSFHLRHLSLKGNSFWSQFELSVNNLDELVRCRKFEYNSLDLSNCSLTDIHFKCLLSFFLNISCLDISYNRQLTKKSIISLEHGLSSKAKEHEKFSHSSFSHETYYLESRTSEVKCGLKELNLTGCFKSQDSPSIYEALLSSCSMYLESIDFRHNNIPTNLIMKTAIVIMKNKPLTTIASLAISLQSDNDWKFLAPCISNLESLTITTSAIMSNESAKCIVNNIKQNKQCNLKLLDISCNRISFQQIKILFPIIATIRNLNLSGIALDIDSVKKICFSLPPRTNNYLHSLDLTNCQLKDEHMLWLKPCIAHIEYLDIQNNPSISNSVIEETVKYVDKMFNNELRFKQLKIGNLVVYKKHVK